MLEDSDQVVSNPDEILMSVNGLEGLKKLVYPNRGDEDDVAEAVAHVLKFGLNKTWKRITFSDAWNVKAIAESVTEAIEDERLSYKVEIKEEGKGKQTLVFEDLRVPPLTAETAKTEHTFRFKKNSVKKTKPNMLKFDEALGKWFESNKNNEDAWKEFAEVLAEQPQIQCVDFTGLKNKDVHKLYGTIEEWARLLNIPGTIFKFVSAQSKSDNTAIASYENLKDRKDVSWHLDGTGGSVSFNDGSMCMKPTKDKIAVTKDKRLLWNRTALDCLFGKKDSLGKMLKDKSKDIDIDIVDFTIGDPKTEWIASDGKKHKWEDVWEYAGSKNFVNDVKGFGTVRVYEDCLGKDARAYLLKNGQNFKYIGSRNGKRVVEITFDTEDDDSAFSTANETDADDKEEKISKSKTQQKKKSVSKRSPKKKVRKHFEEDEEEDEREEMEADY